MYDYLLGGGHNFEVDRAAVDQAVSALPFLPAVARANRAFLGRVVRHLAEAGVDQFLDLGSGIPTAGNVHEVAQEVNPGVHTVYVDIDPIAVAHSGALLRGHAHTEALCADLRQPRQVLDHPAVTRLIDWRRPVGLLMVAVLHFVEDHEDPWAVVDEFKSAIAPGSYLVLSHVTGDEIPDDARRRAGEIYENASAPGVPRSHAQVARFFDGLTMLDPGLVSVNDWRPALERGKRQPALFYAGVGRKPAPAPEGKQ